MSTFKHKKIKNVPLIPSRDRGDTYHAKHAQFRADYELQPDGGGLTFLVIEKGTNFEGNLNFEGSPRLFRS